MALRTDVEDRFVEVDGLRIRYLEAGSGRPLLCVHGMGFSLSADQWLPHLDVLAGVGHVHALDLPGWGLSDAPDGDDVDWFALWTRVLEGFCEALGLEELDVFGYSIGGWVSCLFARSTARSVRRLVLVDSPGMNVEAPAFLSRFTPPTREALHEDVALHMRHAFDPAMVDVLEERLGRPGQAERYARVARHVGDTDVRRANSLHAVFPELAMPVLLCQMDNAQGVLVRFLFEAFQLAPNGRLLIYFGGASRLVGGIAPVVEATVVEFLTAAEVPAVARK